MSNVDIRGLYVDIYIDFHLNALELSCNMITSPSVTETWSRIIIIRVTIKMMLVMIAYVCMDINGVPNTELGLPSPVDG